MKNVTISTFSLCVKGHTGREAEYYELDKLPAATSRNGGLPYRSLLSLLEEYLRRVEAQAARDENSSSLLSASEIHTKSHSVSAFLQRGEYGIQSELLNVDNVKVKEITYHRSISDAEMLPYYFLAAVPAESKRGIVAFQTEANSGTRLQFEQGFEDFLREECGKCDLEIDKLVPRKLINQYFKQARVARLRFVRLSVPKTIDQAYMNGNLQMSATMELQMRPKRGSAFLLADNIVAVLNKHKQARDFIQIKGFEYDTVKIDVQMGGKYRTINLSSPDSFRADYDVTKKIKRYGGHPTYKSIDRIAREIVSEIMVSLKMDGTGV